MSWTSRTRGSRTTSAWSTRLAGPVVENAGARVVALGALTVVTIIVARTGGPTDVGILALMRVLPGVLGVVVACGLPGAVTYFLAGPDRANDRLWASVLVVLGVGALGGSALWFAATPVIQSVLFADVSLPVVALAGLTVATQLPVSVGKSALQGLGDLRASNLVLAAEEAAFLPVFCVGYLLGLRSATLIVIALLVTDLLVGGGAATLVRRRAHALQMSWSPHLDPALTRRVVSFGVRNQVGGLMGLLNLRLDFLVLGALTGPATVGLYGVASKYAELLRLPALAVTWVNYPRIARQGGPQFLATAGRQPLRLIAAGFAGAIVLGVAASWVLPLVYGEEFTATVAPAVVLVLGLALEPAAALGVAYLLGTGRPGRNSLIVGVGLVITLTLDALLIPVYGVMGAAWASTLAYLVTDLCLIFVIWRPLRHAARHASSGNAP
ncbi:MAG: polysaccharide biosynthesis C-terminal domain-containing protein [Ornithinimicrobium sp.]